MCELGRTESVTPAFGGWWREAAGPKRFFFELPDGNYLPLDDTDLHNRAIIKPFGDEWSSRFQEPLNGSQGERQER